LLNLASASLGVPVAQLTVTDGVVSGGGRSVTYGALLGGKPFNTTINTTAAGSAPIKSPSQYKVVGTRVPRFDIPDKVRGKWTFIQDVAIPGMLHGRPVRPRGTASVHAKSPEGGPASFTLLSVDESSIKNLAGARVVREKNFLGVVAPTEYAAIQGAAQLKARWSETETLPGHANMERFMRESPVTTGVVLNYGNVDTAIKSAAKVITATYEFPVQIHGPIGPVCSIADVRGDRVTIFMSGQDTWGYRPGIALAAGGIPVNNVRLIHYEGASTFNREPHNHPAVDATIMSRLAGAPVRVQHMRHDSMGYEAYGQHNLADMRGGLDANGKILTFEHVSWMPPNITNVSDGTNVPGNQQIGHPLPPDATSGGGSTRSQPFSYAGTSQNASGGGARIETFQCGDQYFPNLPNRRVTGRTLKNLFRTSPLRAPACIQANWAGESFMDELAYAAGEDPVAFRRKHITSDAWMAVLDAVAKTSNWQPRRAASNLSDERIVRGRGVSIGGETHTHSDEYAGVVAEITVDRKTGKISVTHMHGAQDGGFIVNPASVENQIAGMLVQGVSRTLVEQMTFNKRRVTGLDWVSYPTLRFQDTPKVTTAVITRPNEIVPANLSPADVAGPRYRGVGEPTVAAVPSAIANALFDATGVRMRQLPLTPAKVRNALAAAGRLYEG
jgi:CO/xanthine dehydrogenase Mo-binding subunit